MTAPSRTIMTLFMPSIWESSASTYFRRSAERTPFSSGAVRGSGAAASVVAIANRAVNASLFIGRFIGSFDCFDGVFERLVVDRNEIAGGGKTSGLHVFGV